MTKQELFWEKILPYLAFHTVSRAMLCKNRDSEYFKATMKHENKNRLEEKHIFLSQTRLISLL